LPPRLVIVSVQTPSELNGPPENRSENGNCGLNRPVKGGPPSSMGVVAESSKTVVVKLL
jgi:hypothetical protein